MRHLISGLALAAGCGWRRRRRPLVRFEGGIGSQPLRAGPWSTSPRRGARRPALGDLQPEAEVKTDGSISVEAAACCAGGMGTNAGQSVRARLFCGGVPSDSDRCRWSQRRLPHHRLPDPDAALGVQQPDPADRSGGGPGSQAASQARERCAARRPARPADTGECGFAAPLGMRLLPILRAHPSNLSTRMTPAERRASGSLAMIFAARMLGLFLVLPVFALEAARYPGGGDPALVGMAMGIYGLTQGFLQIPSAWLGPLRPQARDRARPAGVRSRQLHARRRPPWAG